MRSVGVRPAEPAIELGSTAAVKQAVADGIAPTVISRLTVRTELAEGRLREVSVEGLDLRRDLRAVWLRGVDLAPLGRRLLDTVAA